MADRSTEARAGVPALEVEGLAHSFGKRKALDGVSFAIPPGSFTVLLGQNGAGKTTLFNLITRLYSNRTGSIRIFGIEVRSAARAARSPSSAWCSSSAPSTSTSRSCRTCCTPPACRGFAHARGEAARRGRARPLRAERARARPGAPALGRPAAPGRDRARPAAPAAAPAAGRADRRPRHRLAPGRSSITCAGCAPKTASACSGRPI